MEIDEIITSLVKTGEISCRDDVIDFLRENNFELKREGKTYISVVHNQIRKKNGELKPLRLKGDYYGRSFTSSEELERGIRETASGAGKSVDKIRTELERIVRKQAIYNRERYQVYQRSEPSEQVQIRGHTQGKGIEVSDRKKCERTSDREREYENRDTEEELVRQAERRILNVKCARRITSRSRSQARSRKRREAERTKNIRKFAYEFSQEFGRALSGVNKGELRDIYSRAETINKVIAEVNTRTRKDDSFFKRVITSRRERRVNNRFIRELESVLGKFKQTFNRLLRRLNSMKKRNEVTNLIKKHP